MMGKLIEGVPQVKSVREWLERCEQEGITEEVRSITATWVDGWSWVPWELYLPDLARRHPWFFENDVLGADGMAGAMFLAAASGTDHRSRGETVFAASLCRLVAESEPWRAHARVMTPRHRGLYGTACVDDDGPRLTISVQHAVRGMRFRPDFLLWVTDRRGDVLVAIAAEIDGPQHDGPIEVRFDRVRDRAIASRIGGGPLRWSADEALRDPLGAASECLGILSEQVRRRVGHADRVACEAELRAEWETLHGLRTPLPRSMPR